MTKKNANARINTGYVEKKAERRSLKINIFKTIFKIFIDIIIFIEIVLIALFFFPRIIGIKTYIVTSGSMEPLYPIGSLVYVKSVDASEIKIGDAITFYMNESTIVATHQVYEINEGKSEFRTQGINNKDENG